MQNNPSPEGFEVVGFRCQWDYDDGTVTEFFGDISQLPGETDEQPTEVAALVMATDVVHRIETLRALIADDAVASQAPTLDAYRAILLAALEPPKPVQRERGRDWIERSAPG